MAICKFWQQGNCKNGNDCRFDHVGPGGSQSQNRFGAFNNAPPSTGRGFGDRYRPGNNSRDENTYGVTTSGIETDLSKERPVWPLSCYGPGKDAPRQLFGGFPVEQSPEEMRMLAYTAAANGTPEAAMQHERTLLEQVNGQVQKCLSDLNGAVKYVLDGRDNHPNRHDECTSENTTGATSQPQANPFSSASSAPSAFGPNSTTSTFGQPSLPGQTSTFGQPSAPGQIAAFGKPSGLGTTPAFGQSAQPAASAFGQPSALGNSAIGNQPAFGQASAPGFGKPAFGQISQPAFGQPSQPGATSTFGQPSQPGTTSAFGQPAQQASTPAFGQPSAFGQAQSQASPAFGKPSQPASTPAFGQPPQPVSASAFGQPSQPAAPSAFGQPSQPSAAPAFGQPSALGKPAFGSPSQPASFGNQSQSNGSAFGKPLQPASSAPPFGSSTSTVSQSPFGAQQPATGTTFGAQQTSASPFAAHNNTSQTSTFGQPASGLGNAAQSGSLQPTTNGFSAANTASVPRTATFPPSTTDTRTKNQDGTLASLNGRPVSYQAWPPHVEGGAKRAQTNLPFYKPNGGDWERVWLSDTPQNNDAAEPQLLPNVDTAALAEAYKFAVENGKFKDGIMPELPPKREWVSFNL